MMGKRNKAAFSKKRKERKQRKNNGKDNTTDSRKNPDKKRKDSQCQRIKYRGNITLDIIYDGIDFHALSIAHAIIGMPYILGHYFAIIYLYLVK